jgi:hypothetical protein
MLIFSILGFHDYITQYGGLMNDCKAVYRKVNHFVQCLYPGQLKGNLRRNMNTLSAMVTGIIIKETQLPLIALNMLEEIKVSSTDYYQ